jgi:hypothetical protein
MSKRSASRTRSGPWVYIAFVVVIYVIGSLAYALATDSSACGVNNAQREWRFIPPGWDCPSTNF